MCLIIYSVILVCIFLIVTLFYLIFFFYVRKFFIIKRIKIIIPFTLIFVKKKILHLYILIIIFLTFKNY